MLGVQFVMNKACSVKLQDLFQRSTTNKIEFKVSDDALDLSCLDDLRKGVEEERFLPKSIFVRKYLQHALDLRLNHDAHPTVVFGSPGIGKSIFSFLAAIALALTGRHKAVLYVRKIRDQKEAATSLFWMAKTDDETVHIVACRHIYANYTVPSLCTAIAYRFFTGDINKSNSPTDFGIKCIVDGPRYDNTSDKVAGSDLVTSGGCPPTKQENMDEWHFPMKVWSLDELSLALKILKKCNRGTTEKIFDTTGGCIRHAIQCCSKDGKVEEAILMQKQKWIDGIVTRQANDAVVNMAYYSSQLSADKKSLDRLRAMMVTEDPEENGGRTFFETTLVLGSAHIARKLWFKLSIDEVQRGMMFAKSTMNQSLFGWHFELWCHKLSETAIDQWRQQAQSAAARKFPVASVEAAAGVGGISAATMATGTVGVDATVTSGSIVGTGFNASWPAYTQATGTGMNGIAALNTTWLYWKPSVPNFANIDAAILLEDGTLLCLQFTVGDEHAFDIRSFLHGFVYNISGEVQKKISTIKIAFVVPEDVTFSAVRVPIEQQPLIESHCSARPSQVSGPRVKYVRPRQSKVVSIPKTVVVPGTEDGPADMDVHEPTSMMDMDTEASEVVSYDESLDGGWSSVEPSTMTDDVPCTFPLEFQTMTVSLALLSGQSPFFALPLQPAEPNNPVGQHPPHLQDSSQF